VFEQIQAYRILLIFSAAEQTVALATAALLQHKNWVVLSLGLESKFSDFAGCTEQLGAVLVKFCRASAHG